MADVTANIPFDAIAFIEEVVNRIQSDIDFAYQGVLRSFDEDNAHTALSGIQGKVEALRAFIKALDAK